MMLLYSERERQCLYFNIFKHLFSHTFVHFRVHTPSVKNMYNFVRFVSIRLCDYRRNESFGEINSKIHCEIYCIQDDIRIYFKHNLVKDIYFS